jgi:hypothetical protein
MEELYDKVMSIINEWDPISLIAVGAPEHEYSIEIDYFLPLIMKAKPEEYPEIINQTFGKYFDNVYRAKPEEVMEVSKKLYETIQDYDISV